MNVVEEFNTDVLIVSVALLIALAAFFVTRWVPIPAPALLLLTAAVASDLAPELGIKIVTVERIGVVALIIILLDGGIHVGWRRFRGSAVPIAALGIVGTFVTAAVVAVAAHYLLDFSWTTSWLIGAALAPTDPAVMFSVLGNREVGGRSGTILEGESGVNDPVGIALMIGIIEFAQADDGSLWDIAEEFAFQMVVGLAVGVAAGLVLARVIQLALPREGLYPIRVLIAAGFAYGLASIFHGSGFLAVFIAGLLIADVHAPYKTEIERFHTALASLAEIAVFIALGLTIAGPSDLFDDLPEGLLLALVTAFVARPIAVLLLLPRVPLRWGERLFIMWGGLKGAVPILLAAFVLIADLDDSLAVYNIVFVVVAFSVIVQGSAIPLVARRLRVPMRAVELSPWDYSIRLRSRPESIRSFVVGEGSRVVGRAIRELPLGEDTWISLVVREGEARHPRGSYVLEPADEVHVLTSEEDIPALRRLFAGKRAET